MGPCVLYLTAETSACYVRAVEATPRFRLRSSSNMKPKPAQRHRHGAFFAVDVESFNRSDRTDADLSAVRERLQELVAGAFADAQISVAFAADAGDAVLAITAASAEKADVVWSVLPALERRLAKYNRDVAEHLRIRLRTAIHFGEYTKDQLQITGAGVTSREITVTFRLLDSRLLRDALSHAPTTQLACLISEEFFSKILLQQGPEQASVLKPCVVQTKDATLSAWAYGFDPTQPSVAPRKPLPTTATTPSAPVVRLDRPTTEVLASFMREMDEIWEAHFDAAWDAILTIDYPTERTLTLKLDLFFQEYHKVFSLLIAPPILVTQLKKQCRSSRDVAWQLAVSSWELIAQATMTKVHLETKGRRRQNDALEQADRSLRGAQATNSPRDKCERFKTAVQLLRDDSKLGTH